MFAAIALVGATPRAHAERTAEFDLAPIRAALASAYHADRVEADDALDEFARSAPAERSKWLADPDPRLRRAAGRLLARHPDPELAPELRAAFLRERDPAVLEALVAALAHVPATAATLGEAVKAAGEPTLSAAAARLVRAVACDAVTSKVRNGGVPGFYDGQFSDLWALVPSMPEELLAVASDDSYHNVVRVLAVMALHETRRPTLERDLAGLVQPERLELRNTLEENFDRSPTSIDVLRRRDFVISRYARFALAKAGQTAALRRMIREVDDYLAEEPQKRAIEFRGDRDENPGPYYFAEFLRDLQFEVGYYFQQFDDYAAAEQRYVNLIARFPESRSTQNAHYNLACICSIQGRRREALDHLRAAIACGFTDHRWLLEDADLAPLRGDAEFQELVDLARTGLADDSGRDWIRNLQRFLPAGTRSFFDLGPDEQRGVLVTAAAALSPSQRRRLVADAPPEQRERLQALLGDAGGDR